jgi:hypothetical protein
MKSRFCQPIRCLFSSHWTRHPFASAPLRRLASGTIRPRLVSGVVLIASALLVSGCGRSEARLRARATAFAQCLADGNIDDAVQFGYYNNIGDSTPASMRVGFVMEVKQIAASIGSPRDTSGRKSAGFEVRKVEIDKTKTQAMVEIVFFTTDLNGADREEQPMPMGWTLSNGIWCVGGPRPPPRFPPPGR